MNRFHIRLAGPDRDADGSLAFRVNLYDRTCEVESPAWQCGADYYCVYGATALDALVAAVRDVYHGTAFDHFEAERKRYGSDWKRAVVSP